MQTTVLRWNIWYKEPIQNILKVLKEIDADIICLQELAINNTEQSTADTVRYIADGLGFNVAFCEIPLENQEMNLANAIFTRFDVLQKCTAWINQPTGTNNYDDEYRAYVQADVRIRNTSLRIGTVHMSYTHAFEPTTRKMLETSNLINEIKDNNSNFILTGDFNATPGSPVIDLIQKQLMNVGPDLLLNTWTTKPFSYGGFTAKELDWRLDYVFASSDIKVIKAEIIQTDFSDHLPILATFEVS